MANIEFSIISTATLQNAGNLGRNLVMKHLAPQRYQIGLSPCLDIRTLGAEKSATSVSHQVRQSLLLDGVTSAALQSSRA